MPRSFLAACVAAAALVCAPAVGRANGRIPVGRYLVGGPGTFSNVLALQATFGVLISTDSGRTWRWTCEDSLGFTGVWDPPLTITADGALYAGLLDGVTTARGDFCNFTRPASAPTSEVLDLASDPDGTRVAAALSPLGMPNGVAISDDRGASWHMGWTRSDFFITTVDIAPGHPDTMYVSGYLTSGAAIVLRSTDGGATFAERGRDFRGGYNAFISAVDPAQPDTVYVRSDLTSGGTVLLRSDDGGMTFRELVHTNFRMLGVGFAPDGMRMWVGSTNPCEGIQHSADGGRTWRTVNRQYSTLCMRFHAGRLFVCGDPAADGFVVSASSDDGATFMPLLRLSDVQSPAACAAGTSVRDRCDPLWPALSMNVLRADAGPPSPPVCPDDAGADASAGDGAAPDGGMDVAIGADAGIDAGADATGSEGRSVTGTGCGACAVGAGGAQHGARGGWALVAMAMVAWGGRPRPQGRGRRRRGRGTTA